MSLLPSGAIETGGYDINNSLRFRSSASAYLNRTPASASNRQIFTFSYWLKRGTLGVDQQCYGIPSTVGNQGAHHRFNSSDNFRVNDYTNGVSDQIYLVTTQVFRDPSAWYHIVIAIDTTQATAANRVKLYINGNQVTGFTTATYPSQNQNLAVNLAKATYIGYGDPGNGGYFDGYITEYNFIDGQALTPTSFGETDAVTGVWKAKKYTGTYGTNGFYLKFANTLSSGFSSHYGSFNGSSQYLSISSCNATNFNTGDYTVEAWVYQNSRADLQFIVGGSSTCFQCYIEANGTLNLGKAGTASIGASTGSVPLGIWTHVAYVRSGTTVTYYINGIASGTATDSNSYNLSSTTVNIATSNNNIGSYDINGNLSNVRVVKGSAVYTSNFTPPTANLTAVTNTSILTLQNSTIIDNSTNAWSITNTGSVAMTSATIGTYLIIANDSSSNNNHWIPNNISVTSGTTYDAMTDSPTLTSTTVANYAVLSPLDWVSASGTLSAGNLNWASSTNVCGNKSTIGATSGKWYWEAVGSSVTSGTIGGRFGFTGSDTIAAEQDKFGMYWHPTSGIARIVNGTNTYVTSAYTYTNSDVLALALDLDSNISYWYKNGVLQYTFDFSSFSTIGSRVFHAYAWNASSGTPSWVYNFGQRPFAYTPRTNHLALNTYNLPDSTIKKGNSYMDATLYTGNGSTQTITNAAGFRPDFVWIKRRDGSGQDHVLQDSNRGFGGTKKLASSSTAAENVTGGATGSEWGSVTAANSNGFSITASTSGDQVNKNTWTYVGWQWQAGQGTNTTNTAGSITSTVSVNATAGFSVVTYTGNATNNATIGHGLGVAPKMVITKNRATTTFWYVYHSSLPATNNLYLNTTDSQQADNVIRSTNATTFTVSSSSAANGTSMVAYCWAEIAGFSRFGSYTGNGSADGTFIYTGFLPKFIMIKCTDTAGTAWVTYDTSRDTYNVAGNILLPNSSSAELSGYSLDVLSNGFKHRQGGGDPNATSRNYIYACFASNPFKNSLAR